jgi:hypothetical protein
MRLNEKNKMNENTKFNEPGVIHFAHTVAQRARCGRYVCMDCGDESDKPKFKSVCKLKRAFSTSGWRDVLEDDDEHEMRTKLIEMRHGGYPKERAQAYQTFVYAKIMGDKSYGR